MVVRTGMGFFVIPSLILTYTSSYLYREDGIPLPFSSNRINIWDFMINNKPQAPSSILLENFLTWSLLYTTMHILMYVEPQRSLFHPFKLNPNYPKTSLILKEVCQSACGVLIISIYEVFINRMYQEGSLPTRYALNIWSLSETGYLSPLVLVAAALVLYMNTKGADRSESRQPVPIEIFNF